jgi:hypothetical protein
MEYRHMSTWFKECFVDGCSAGQEMQIFSHRAEGDASREMGEVEAQAGGSIA